MNTDLTQAVADARQAEANAVQIAQILAVVQAAQAATPAPAAHAACSCSHGKAGGSAGKTVALVAGAAGCVCVLTGMFLAVALTAVAVGVSATVLYLLWTQIRKGK